MDNQELLTYAPGTTVEGVYKSYGPKFGFLITDKEHEDIYIAERDRGTAVNNDTVVVKVTHGTTGRHKVEGRIINITSRANETWSAPMKCWPTAAKWCLWTRRSIW